MLKKILLIPVIVLLYYIPGFIFKSNPDFYNSINLPKYAPPAYVFGIAWGSIYLLLSIFIVFYFKKDDFDKVASILLIINYFIMFFFNKVFFLEHLLYWSFVISLFSFVTMLLVYFNALVTNRKLSTLLVPYLLWTVFATVLMANIYLIN